MSSDLLPRIKLNNRTFCDLELLLVEGFSPLTGFMDKENYESVVESMRLSDGSLFPIPVVLDIKESDPYNVGDTVLLCDPFGNPVASMSITSRYTPDKNNEIKKVYGTDDVLHPGVRYVLDDMGPVYIGGTVTKIELPKHNDFIEYRHTPAELKALFIKNGWNKVVGFQTRNPLHRAHFELIKRAHELTGAPILVHPVVGMTKPGDIDYITRVRTYSVVCNKYARDFTYLSLLPLAMRMAGPREALWHAIIRKNYGCTHFIVGRDHAGPGKRSDGKDFYEPYEARDCVLKYSDEIGITIVASDELAYSKKRNTYIASNEITADDEIESISGTEFRRLLLSDQPIPEWFSFTECIEILRNSVQTKPEKGVTFFFTGLPSSGKTTLANQLLLTLQLRHSKQITFLDGDVIREHLSKGLGFSREDRDENVRRVGFVASEIARHGGVVVCSLIAPYEKARQSARSLVEQYGYFVEVFVDTSLEECIRRDTKGLYKRAKEGVIKNFTGIDDPYEAPKDADFIAKTEFESPQEIIHKLIKFCEENGYLKSFN